MTPSQKTGAMLIGAVWVAVNVAFYVGLGFYAMLFFDGIVVGIAVFSVGVMLLLGPL